MFKRITLIGCLFCLFACLHAQTYEGCIERAYQAAQHDSLELAEALFRQALKMNPGDHRNALVHHDM